MADLPAGLSYADDRTPGYTRKWIRGKYRYFDTDGRRITDRATIERIDTLAIPPAYTDVWICPDKTGHIQATGRDARRRKQYRYNPTWCAVRDANKYGRLLDFGRALARIRRQVNRDMKRPGLGRERIAATIVRLLEVTLIRVGNEKYAKANRSYGLTTLQNRHANVSGADIRFRFRGKSGIDHDVTLNDARVARIVRRCMEIPGQELFQYMDDEGGRHPIGSGDVNAYLRGIAGADFSAKDYRTWAGSAHTLALLRKSAYTTPKAARRTVVEVIKAVSVRLANTPAVCRRCYVHPSLLNRYLDGKFTVADRIAPRELGIEERRLLGFLEQIAK